MTHKNARVELELFFQNCFVCQGLLGVVLLWIFELLIGGSQGRLKSVKREKISKNSTEGQTDENVILHIFSNVG